MWLCQCPPEEVSEFFCTTRLPWRHSICCTNTSSVSDVTGCQQKGDISTELSMGNTSWSCNQVRVTEQKHFIPAETVVLDFIILIFWASLQCQQKAIHSSGRSHQSTGNELYKRLQHQQKLGNKRHFCSQNSRGVTCSLCEMLIFCFMLVSWCHCQHSESFWEVAVFCENCMEASQMSMCESEHFSRIRDCSLHSSAAP